MREMENTPYLREIIQEWITMTRSTQIGGNGENSVDLHGNIVCL
jgi:hypothetical protein